MNAIVAAGRERRKENLRALGCTPALCRYDFLGCTPALCRYDFLGCTPAVCRCDFLGCTPALYRYDFFFRCSRFS